MIWIVGSKGMLGSEILNCLNQTNIPYYATDSDVNITNINSLFDYVSDKDISWIINTAAYTAVDKAEYEKEVTFAINGKGVENLVIVAKQMNAKLIHFSTDYVFDGLKETEYVETDNIMPQTIYGHSKVVGEMYAGKYDKSFCFRLSWMYGKFGPNFIFTMLKQFGEKNKVKVVGDQFGSPTSAKDVAEMVLHLIQTNSEKYGLYHYSGKGKTSWLEFATTIHYYCNIPKIICFEKVNSSYFKSVAKRPKNSYMSKEKFEKTFPELIINDWQISLQNFIEDLRHDSIQ